MSQLLPSHASTAQYVRVDRPSTEERERIIEKDKSQCLQWLHEAVRDVHDFDYFAGAGRTHQRRLKARGVGGFDGDRGEFYGEDRDNGRPVTCEAGRPKRTWAETGDGWADCGPS